MATKKLARTVTILDEDAGQYVTYQAGDEVPDNHAKLITNPNAWDEGEEEEEQKPPPGEAQMRSVEEDEEKAAEDKPATRTASRTTSGVGETKTTAAKKE